VADTLDDGTVSDCDMRKCVPVTSNIRVYDTPEDCAGQIAAISEEVGHRNRDAENLEAFAFVVVTALRAVRFDFAL
jgi:hypothetical protein